MEKSSATLSSIQTLRISSISSGTKNTKAILIFLIIVMFSPLLFAQQNYQTGNENNYSSTKLIQGVPASLEKIKSFSTKNNISNEITNNEKQYNVLYCEIFGNGGTFSFNYERNIFLKLNIRIGFGILIGSSSSNSGEHTETGADVFGMLNYLIEIYKNNNLELGAGILTQGTKTLPTFSLGYRYIPQQGGFFFKLTFDMKPNFDNKFIPWGGLGLGVRS